ncbi:sulfurtransferase [Salipiger sp. IMCC34102]|uniref:sulfurtransferase n=1 Tax=Salipiger sp. IMCC34102 TaxID=2510647 RepID=UPI00101BE929|nr:sulfurtransferase [Salipiger sp. IMCC34102]RYH01256.1 sulfurtransferase [Salipiger sp. IMCC34102]
MTDPIVTPGWLSEHLGDVIVLDATYFLPPDPARVRQEYQEAHIPGAQLFEIDVVADPDHPLPHMMPDADTFAEAMAGLGIDGSRRVVVYDRSANHFSAPRVWFTLQSYGMTETAVLDGGLSAWQAEGHPVATGQEAASPVPRQSWSREGGRILTARDVARAAKDGRPILDARSQDRFDGTAPEPRPGVAPGHMPGAQCLPFTALTDAAGRFQDQATLNSLFGGLDAPEPVVTCGSGMTACVLALGLARIGRRARLYDGSWAEWGTGAVGPILTKAS